MPLTSPRSCGCQPSRSPAAYLTLTRAAPHANNTTSISSARRQACRDLVAYSRFCPQHVRLEAPPIVSKSPRRFEERQKVESNESQSKSGEESAFHQLPILAPVETIPVPSAPLLSIPFSSFVGSKGAGPSPKVASQVGSLPRMSQVPVMVDHDPSLWPLGPAAGGRFIDGRIPQSRASNRSRGGNVSGTSDFTSPIDDRKQPLILVSALLQNNNSTPKRSTEATAIANGDGKPTPFGHVKSQLVNGRSYYYGLYNRPPAEYQIDQNVTKAINALK